MHIIQHPYPHVDRLLLFRYWILWCFDVIGWVK